MGHCCFGPHWVSLHGQNTETFFKISSVLCQRKKVIQIWNNIRTSKWWVFITDKYITLLKYNGLRMSFYVDRIRNHGNPFNRSWTNCHHAARNVHLCVWWGHGRKWEQKTGNNLNLTQLLQTVCANRCGLFWCKWFVFKHSIQCTVKT